MLLSWKDDDVSLDELTSELRSKMDSLRVVRADFAKGNHSAMLQIAPKSDFTLDELSELLFRRDGQVSCSFFESKTNW